MRPYPDLAPGQRAGADGVHVGRRRSKGADGTASSAAAARQRWAATMNLSTFRPLS